MLLYLGVAILLYGLAMMAKGWAYTLKPDGKLAEKRKRVNLRRGFTTDMKLFGRKIRRLGLMIALVGGGLVGWKLSAAPETAAVDTAGAPALAPSAPAAP